MTGYPVAQKEDYYRYYRAKTIANYILTACAILFSSQLGVYVLSPGISGTAADIAIICNVIALIPLFSQFVSPIFYILGLARTYTVYRSVQPVKKS